ncbi:transposase [Streptomyces sp. NPDC006012]|uniref:transposase n=1 Tax=Streptomyces sp. NPDC006012 TaxID=3364739 RepID=UPI003692207F
MKAACTRTDARRVSFLPRDLYDTHSESRTEQQTQEWLPRYSLRAAIESTISEFVNGHGMRQCRYRSEDKAHVQHVLTAIAVNLERIDAHLPPEPASPSGLPRLAAHPPAPALARRHPPRRLS